MATFLFLVQLLFTGTLIVPASTQSEDRCNLLSSATPSNFTVNVTPEGYQANTTYTVTISDNSKNVTEYLLQALSLKNASIGEWNMVETQNCSSVDMAVLPATQKAANWTSPESNISSVEIRAYIIFSDKPAKFTTVPLNMESSTAPTATTPNSVSMVQSSSFFIAAIQLPLLLLTSKLFS